MSQSNGVIRIGRKGIKKFAFGDDGPVFEVDVVATMQQWFIISDSYRTQEDTNGDKSVPLEQMCNYHAEAQTYVTSLQGDEAIHLTVAEALDFLARLREEFNRLADFFRPKLQEEEDSPDTSGPRSESQYSVEGEKS